MSESWTTVVELDASLADAARESLRSLLPTLDPAVLSVRVHRRRIVFEHRPPLDPEALRERALDVVERVERVSAAASAEVLRESKPPLAYAGDPWDALTAAGLVHEVVPGLCQVRGPLAGLLEAIDGRFAGVARSVGAGFESYPPLLPAASLATGYVASFPQHCLFVVAAHQSHAALRELAGAAAGGRLPAAPELAPPQLMLAPTVCHHTFEARRGTVVAPGTVVSARNGCHRMERGAERLLRLTAFQMREIVFFGTEEHVDELRLRILDACCGLLDGWGLRYRAVTASDPFFLTGGERRAIFQQLARSKIELQLEIPHRDEHVAVMSFNHHRQSLARAYRLEPGELVSGCFGVGLERLLYALAAQHGPDPDRLAAIVAA